MQAINTSRTRFVLVVFLLAFTSCESREQKQDIPNTASPQQVVAEPALDREVFGKLGGKAFSLEESNIEKGILELRQGKDFFADRSLTIFLFLKDGKKVPENQTFRVTPDSTGMLPHVHVKWKEEGKNMPETNMFMNGYTMTLEFGEEKEFGKLPGTISFSTPGTPVNNISGTFVAVLKDFRIVDGKPTLGLDSFDTLKYVLAEHLKKKLAVETIQFTESDGTRMVTSKHSDKPWAQGRYTFHTGDNKPQHVKVNFIKNEDSWALQKELPLTAIFKAHPVYPLKKGASHYQRLWQVGAKQLEKDLKEKKITKEVKQAQFSGNYAKKSGLGRVEVRYTFPGEEEKKKKYYLFRLKDEQWKFDRELAADETLNSKTGAVEKKTT